LLGAVGVLGAAGVAAGFAAAPVEVEVLELSVELGVTELVVPRESFR
jgi:hypothetical protein